MNKNELFKKYLLLNPSNQKKYLVIGDDIDSYLSASIFLKYNPNTEIIGFYEKYKTLFIIEEYKKYIKDTLWIDLDIYNKFCNSLGHHIIRNTLSDRLTGIENSCNFNEMRGIYCGNFNRKYPLGTIHFLISIYNEDYQINTEKELLIWLADSTYINGQSHRYRNNVEEWINNFLLHEGLKNTFRDIDSEDFENRMLNFYTILKSKNFKQGKGQVVSRHLQLGGFQFQCTFSDKQYFDNICDFINKITDWPNISKYVNRNEIVKFEGIRKSAKMSKVLNGNSLDDFLNQNNIFSYVIPNTGIINYTTNIVI